MGIARDYVKLVAGSHFPNAWLWKLVLENGREFQVRHFGKSLELKKDIHAVPRACFHNCQNAALTYDYQYWEGFANSILPVQHAWVLDAEGNLLDPTWVRNIKATDYFGIQIPTSYIRQQWLKTKWSRDLIWGYLQKNSKGDL